MRPKSPIIPLCGLLLVVVLGLTFPSGPAAVAQDTAPPAPVIPSGKKAVAYVLERVRRTGSFNHPDYPWVVRARCVRGDTLYFVDFLHRRKDGKGFDVVGKAVQVTLSFSKTAEPFGFPFDGSIPEGIERPPVRRDTLRAGVFQMEMQSADGSIVSMEYYTFDLALPAELRRGGFRPFAKAAARLSREQREALGKEYSLDRGQKLLLTAFRPESFDLFRTEIMVSATGQTVFAFERSVERDADGRHKFPTLAIARFDKTGKVLTRFRGKNIIVEGEDLERICLEGEDIQGMKLKGTSKLDVTFPGVKADH